MHKPLTTPHFIRQIQTNGEPIQLRRGATHLNVVADSLPHRQAFLYDPELYALLALAPEVQPWQRARMLLQLLHTSRLGLSQESRVLVERITSMLLRTLAPDQVLTVLLALRRSRANHKHVTRAVLQFICEHPHADALIQLRRPTLRDCFEHAVGKATARACANMLAGQMPVDASYLHRHLLRFVGNADTAAQSILALYAPAQSQDLPTLPPPPALEAVRERPQTVTATNRGDIAATLVHRYRGGPSLELEQAIDAYVASAAAPVPRFDGSVALVFDASASTRSYGDREWACLSQSVALRLLLERCCAHLVVLPVGGDGAQLPMPQGSTDLASGLLDALEQHPDLVLIVSDGYENQFPGDLARVVATLPQIGVETPVLFCQSVFTNSDDLTLRQPAPALPQRSFWHQDDFEPLLFWLFAHAGPTYGEPWLRTALLRRLEQAEEHLAA